MLQEVVLRPLPGIPAVLGLLVGALLATGGLIAGAAAGQPIPAIGAAVGLTVCLFCFKGIVQVEPNDGAVVTLFGKYAGTVRQAGLWWVNPFTSRHRVSLRVRSQETARLKVNDAISNPIEIAAIIVWKVVDTAEACFEVDDFEKYVLVQSESAVRALAQSYPYDAHEPGEIALSTHPGEVSAGLKRAVEDRLAKAGVEVVEARISHLAYAPEIAAAMLQRQQASALIAARQKIVEGAVGIVENALDLLGKRAIVQLDEERKAAMVSNLLVVLCSERGASPVVNAGSLYT